MKNTLLHLVLFLLLLFGSLSAQQVSSDEVVTALDNPVRRGYVAVKDTVPDPSDMTSGEIIGLENEERRIKPEGTKEKRRADKLYSDLGFEESSKVYQALNKRERKNEKVLARIANSHRLNHETENAAFWYAKFINNTKESKHLLHYAQVLQSNGKCEDAIRWYKEYKKVASKKELKNRDFIVNCDESQIASYPGVSIRNVKELNTAHLDFSPIPYAGGVVFTSTRGRDKWVDEKDNWTSDNFTDLFYAKRKENGEFEEPVSFLGEVNGRFHDGTASFNQGNSVMVFTRNNTKGESKEGLIDLKVYSANKDNDYWADIEELPFNSNDYSTCHPTMTSGGRRIYFSSNRPGGFGGMDIYVVEAQGGSWSEPLNLGATVNSSGNEIFPFIAEDESLFYSSNGHVGIGGLDIFKATKANKDDENSWIYRENAGKPFNSKKDDFGFYINEEQTMGYLSSTRKGGSGKDDIYAWETTDGETLLADGESTGMQSRQICVYEDGTENRIGNALVTMSARTGNGNYNSDLPEGMILTLKPTDKDKTEYTLAIRSNEKQREDIRKEFDTNKEGIFNYNKVQRNKYYDITVVKNGFEPVEMMVTSDDLLETQEYCIPMVKKRCVAVDGQVISKKYNIPMPGAKVKLLDKATLEETEYITGADGSFDYCVRCGREYKLSASKSGFDEDYEMVNTIELNCDYSQSVVTLLELEEINRNLVSNRLPEEYSSSSGSSTNSNASNTPEAHRSSSKDALVPVVTYETVTTYEPVTKVQPVTTYVPVNQLNGMYLDRHLNGDPNARLEEGQLITLDEVYYDFNKYNIRTDASIDLKQVLKLMKKYPSMTISLEAHTDARGKRSYNNKLSKKRAKSARKYLISRGISGNRVLAMGFGESRLRNRCADGVKCTERQHQLNRRTEIRIITFNEPGVDIKKGK